MPVTTQATVTAATAAVRQALQAVRVHAEKNTTSADGSVLHRVRLSFGTELHIMATDTQTTGCAVVQLIEDDRKERFAVDDGPFVVDLTPRQAMKIQRHFGSAGVAQAEDMDEVLEFVLSPATLSVTDAGGLFAGEALDFPTLPLASTYPDLPGMLGRALAGVGATPIGKPLVAGHDLLKRFDHAAAAYGEPLEYRGTGTPESRGFTVACGPAFVGLVESRHNEDDWQKRRQSSHMRMLERFPAGLLSAVSN